MLTVLGMHGSNRLNSGAARRFLFLQGPHGPFFSSLAAQLRQANAQVWRVGFNMGDRVFWRDAKSYIAYRGTPDQWPETCAAVMDSHGITDIVLYGDTRPVHAQAIDLAQNRGLTVHVFEEGYLRPYWITYERGGSNGNSRLMQMSLEKMRAALQASGPDQPEAPSHWGDLRQHVFYGALYHWFVLALNRGYPGFKPHRDITVMQEFQLYLRRLLLMPLHRIERWWASRKVQRGGFPYHLVLLQLEHDSSFRMHSPFNKQNDFVRLVIEGFAKGAPGHHHLVFKAHPLEDGRGGVVQEVRRLAAEHGVKNRVHFLRGGKLAAVLDHARTAVTVNSTAAQQVLWRGIPLKTFGRAIYEKPEFVSDLPLADFFAKPPRPDFRAYRDFRQYLLETSQIAGGFYSSAGRRGALRQVVDLMLAPQDPYDALMSGTAAPRQQLRLVT